MGRPRCLGRPPIPAYILDTETLEKAFQNQRKELRDVCGSSRSSDVEQLWLLQAGHLLCTAQVTVIVDDVAAAFLVIIQAGIVPASIACLATRVKIVATDMNVAA
jgi:hypothetical protein